MASQREIPCPFCKGKVIPKQQGRTFFGITSWLQRFTTLQIPITEILNLLRSIVPIPKTEVRKNPETCKACKGKLSIKDPSDDNTKWEQVKSNAQAQADAIIKEESKLSPGCGNRHTLIQGSEIHEVGLSFNDAPAYRVDKEKSIRAWGLLDPSETNPEKAGSIPKGAACNHVQGINSMASPGGHYLMKCANKYSLVSGAQGIEMTTGGPLTINAGIVRFTGPELSIGTQTGRLSLEGEVVNINGKSIEVAPSDGHFFVSGTISNKGNFHCGGHSFMESAAVVKMETTGRNEPSKPASPGDLYTGNTWWGGLAIEGIPSALADLQGLVLSRLTNPVEAQQMISIRFFEDLRDKFSAMAFNIRPLEIHWTGLCKVMYGSSAGWHPVFNFPHHHALPSLSHNHETRIPDIDCTADTAAQLRAKQGGTSSSAPLDKKTGKGQDILTIIRSLITFPFILIWESAQNAYRIMFLGPYDPT